MMKNTTKPSILGPLCTGCTIQPCACLPTETEVLNIRGERVGWVTKVGDAYEATDHRDLPIGTFAKWGPACWAVQDHSSDARVR